MRLLIVCNEVVPCARQVRHHLRHYTKIVIGRTNNPLSMKLNSYCRTAFFDVKNFLIWSNRRKTYCFSVSAEFFKDSAIRTVRLVFESLRKMSTTLWSRVLQDPACV